MNSGGADLSDFGELSLGIDIGGTHVRAAVVATGGVCRLGLTPGEIRQRIVASRKAAVAERSPEAVASLAADAAREALGDVGNPKKLNGVGAAVAGQLRGRTGIVDVAPNLGWRDAPFGDLLASRLGRPARVVNDLKAATWGEYVAGAGQGVGDLLVVFAGSGVGGGYVVAGRLGEGASGVAGEIGHVKVVPRGRLCGCGELGCLEAYAGGHNMVARANEAIAAGRISSLRDHKGPLTPADIERAADLDVVAKEIWADALTYLGWTVGNLVTVLNPAVVIQGGGVFATCPVLKALVRDAASLAANAVSRKAVRFADAALGDDSGVVGAALLAAQREG